MLTRQLVPVLTFLVGAGVALGGCGSSSSGGTGGAGGTNTADGAAGSVGSTGGTGGGTAGTTGTGGSTGGSGGGTAGSGGSAGAGGTSGAGGAPNLGCGTGANTCTKAETDAQNSCVISKCESAYKPCIGDGWRTGNFGGTCGTWFKCINACGCNDANCALGCGLPSAECSTCLMNGNACQTSMCPQPACYGNTGDAGAGGIPDGGFSFPDGGFSFPDGGFNIPDLGFSGTCDDLKKCCDMIADANTKTQCNAIVGSGNALVCGASLTGFKAQNACM